MEKFSKLNETNDLSTPNGMISKQTLLDYNKGVSLVVGRDDDDKETYGLKKEEPVTPIDSEEAMKMISGPETEPEITKSEPCKFVSKIFESREVAHIFHLQTRGPGAYAEHKALEDYYNGILELNDELIEAYQGQYDLIENYDVIDTDTASNTDGTRGDNKIQYFIELAEFIKSTRKMAFLEEDTHLQNIIDEMVILIYRTLYKLKFLK